MLKSIAETLKVKVLRLSRYELLWQILLLLLLYFFFGTLLILCYLLLMMIATLLAHLLFKREPGVIDVGRISRRPLARFRLKNHEIMLHYLPISFTVNGKEVNRITLYSGLILFLIGVALLTLSVWVDGLPCLKGELTLNGQPRPERQMNAFRPMAKVINVDKNSLAAAVPLFYGDIITRIGGIVNPSPSQIAEVLQRAEKTIIRVDRYGTSHELTLDRHGRKGGKRTPWGLTLVSALSLQDQVAVYGVRFLGDAYRLGIRPGDRLETKPSVGELSKGFILNGWRDGHFNTLIVRSSQQTIWPLISTQAPSLGAGIIEISVKTLDVGWASSLELIDQLQYKRHSLAESIMFVMSSLPLNILPMPAISGRDIGIGKWGVFTIHGSNPIWIIIKSFSTIAIYLGFWFTIWGLFCIFFKNGVWVFVVIFALSVFGPLLLLFLRLEIVDSFVIQLGKIYPFSELLFIWRL